MRVIEFFSSMGARPSDVHRYHKQIEGYNLKALFRYSGMVVPLAVVVILTSFFYEEGADTIAAMAVACGLSVVTMWLSYRYYNSSNRNRVLIYAFLTTYNILMYGVAIYTGVFANRTSVGLLFILLLMVVQLNYLISPIWSMIMTLIPCAAFCVSSILCKAPDLHLQDCRNALITFVAGTVLGFINSRERMQFIVANGRLTREVGMLSYATETDPLTGLYNKIVTQEKLADLARDCADKKYSIFAALIDIDFFKMYNDTYGHPMGDEVLRRVSMKMKRLAEEYDIISGRVGGEEFLLCGVVGSENQAIRICERLRYDIESQKIEHIKSEAAPVLTISVGVVFESMGGELTSDELYELADKALYQAKRSGRNCVKRYPLKNA